MDYKTAYNLILGQGAALDSEKNPETFLHRLQQGQPPIPGQVTSILLALRILFDALKEESKLDKDLTLALYQLATESYRQFILGRDRGVDWPPLLREDLDRVTLGVKSILSSQWQEMN